MKLLKILTASIIMLSFAAILHAEDFSVDNIFYNIISRSDLTVEVTFQGEFFESISDEYEGNVVIPSTVLHNDTLFNVTSIGEDAFNDCIGVTSVTIPESVTSIGSAAFRSCTKLTSITIPESVTSIGNGTFYDCSKLTSIVIPNSVTSMGNGVFSSCISLKSVVLSDNVTSIGMSVFLDCGKLTSITLPQNLQSIADYAFSACKKLASITIPEKVVQIKNYAFEGCTGLTSISCQATNPPKIGYNTFSNVNKSIPLYVPSASISSYQSAENWNAFTNIQSTTYLLTFVVDGIEVASERLTQGESIIAPEIGEREGYTFNGWEDLPDVMPAGDLTVYGSFSVNKYMITFEIDGEVILSDYLEYGAVIIVPDVPEREGYTFNGWGYVAKTVPAKDVTYKGTFIVNEYVLTYLVDNDTLYTYTLSYGTSITMPEAPVREGHTFSGWDIHIDVMPAGDVTVYGTFSVNKYLITFEIDGEVILSDSLEYGSIIVVPETPVREGYTFSGWDIQPDVMPAGNVAIYGTFFVNKYLVTFVIDGEVISSDSLEYGATIIVPESPEREGHTFNGWGEIAETVPASDLTYNGTYTVNVYRIYYYVGDEIVYTCEVAYGDEIPEYTYEPTEEGYTFLGWSGDVYETMPAHDISYSANIESSINSSSFHTDSNVIFDLNGRIIYNSEQLTKGIYIINGRKVLLR